MKRGEKVSVENIDALEDWKQAEISAQRWFASHNFKVDWMEQIQRNNKGYDLLIEEKFRVDVKYSNCKKRNKNEFQFNLNKRLKNQKGHGQTTDYYLLMFRDTDITDGKKKFRAYLIPYLDIDNIDCLTICKTKLDKWEQYKLSIDTLKKFRIRKRAKFAVAVAV